MFIAACLDGAFVVIFWDTWWKSPVTYKGKFLIWSKLEQLHKISIIVLVLAFITKSLIFLCLCITSMGSKASKDGIYVTEMSDLNLSFDEKNAREKLRESENNEVIIVDDPRKAVKKPEKKSLWF